MPTIFRDVVTAGDVTFNNPAVPWLPEYPGTEVSAGMDVFLGWDKSPELDAVFTEIGGVDGEIPGEFFAARGRQLLIGGWAHTTDRAIAHLMAELLTAQAFPRNVELQLVRYEPVPKWIRARRNVPIEINWVTPESFRWSTEVRAADPFKYSLTAQTESTGIAGQSTGGRTYPRVYPLVYTTDDAGQGNAAILTNLGTTDSARFTVSINGPLAAGTWRLSNETTGGLLQIDLDLSAIDFLEIDFHTEIILLNNQPITATVIGDFFRLQRGPNVLKLRGDYDSAIVMTVTAFSAWE